jgi:hypothetical protein
MLVDPFFTPHARIGIGPTVYTPEEMYEAIRAQHPSLSRLLYLILDDAKLMAADPNGVLAEQLWKHGQYRLCDAKLLHSFEDCFKGAPSAAVDRFRVLVIMCKVPKGKFLAV